MYCIDRPGVPESRDEYDIHCLYDTCIVVDVLTQKNAIRHSGQKNIGTKVPGMESI